MSKLIVEMEMPRNCQECPLCHAMYLYGSKYCGANGIAYEKEHYKLKRPDRCPIIGELPEQHGDLIDRDRLESRVMAETNPYGKPTIEYESGIKVMQMIENAFTVIPAERAEDD